MDNTEKLATHRVHNDNEGIYETLNKTCKKLDLPTFLNFISLELGIGNRS
jgi:hypothetical protein